MRTAFCTYVSDELYKSIGAEKLIRSAAYFHPEIPFILFGSREIEMLNMPFGLLHPFVIGEVLKNYDKVIYFDADSMITGRLTELLKACDEKGGIIGVRNNNDYDRAGADEPITQPGKTVQNYLNAGLVAVGDSTIVKWWQNDNRLYGPHLPFMEQTVLNCLSTLFTTSIIDPIEAPVYYGVSALSGVVRGDEPQTHWDSWKYVTLTPNGQLTLNGKIVKVLHHAGGFRPDKLDFELFSPEVAIRLKEITG